MAEVNYGSLGQTNLNTVLGAIGTVSALGNGNLLGNLFGGSTTATNDEKYVSKDEFELQRQLGDEKAKNALLQSTIETDKKSLELYAYIDGQLRDIRETLADQRVKNQATDDSIRVVDERRASGYQQLSEAIVREADERKANDNTIITYANATFYPKQVADVTVGSTTTAQTTFNPLPID